MNHSTTVKVRFRKSTIEGQPGSIVYAVTRHRTVRTITTEYKIYPCEWNSKLNRISNLQAEKVRQPTLNSISQHINWDMALLKKIINQLINQLVDFTADDVTTEFVKQCSERSFFSYMRRRITRLRQLNRNRTADNYQSALNSLTRFVQEEDLRFEQITSSLMEEYETWLHDNGVSSNSSSAYLRSLRVAYRQAVDEDLADDINPFKKVYTGVAKTQKRAICVADIKKIKELNLSSIPKLQTIRDIFLFQFYAMGISFIDAAYLKKTDIIENQIRYHRHKTGQLIVVPMNNHIQKIIESYHDPSSPYLLPIILKPGENELRQYNTTLRMHNAGLKTIAKLAGITANLTTYVTRHSWASIAKQKGINLSIISDALGHESTKTTKIYLDSISAKELNDANYLILSEL